MCVYAEIARAVVSESVNIHVCVWRPSVEGSVGGGLLFLAGEGKATLNTNEPLPPVLSSPLLSLYLSL